MRKLAKYVALTGLAILVAFGVFYLDGCKPAAPPADSEHWYCATIADQPDQVDTTNAAPRAVGYKNKWWPVGYEFKVGFIGGSETQRSLLRVCAAKWATVANVKFTYPAAGPYDIRVSFNSGGGAWSYVGIDCKQIPQGSPTMNLGWLEEAAYLHELGHTLGLLHEHQNPTSPIAWNRAAVIQDLSGPPNNWTVAMIEFNVLNPYPLPNVITTALDKSSVMMYPIPATWTLDGFSSTGGKVISAVDKDFIALRYPFSQPPTTGTVTLRAGQIDTLLAGQRAALNLLDSTTAAVKKSDANLRKALGRQ